MIKVENVEVHGIEPAIRGMRNPLNSWALSDSYFDGEMFSVGDKDMDLMQRLYKGGSVHRKYLRQIQVWMDITCHHVWWAEFDTYKVGTTRDSCSKMHKIHVKGFVKDDFSHEGIDEVGGLATDAFLNVIYTLEWLRVKFNETNEKKYWRAIIELLPMGYNIKATVSMSYENVMSMITWREHHKLQEWQDFCKVLKNLPYVDEIRQSE